VLIKALEGFKIFDLPFIMTRGGPGSATETVSVYLYQSGFVFGRLAFITAGSLLILIAITIIVLYFTRRLVRGE